VSLHGKKGLGKKDKKKCHCDKILVHLKEFGPNNTSWVLQPVNKTTIFFLIQL
jgi:hypothetical protein